MTSIDAILERTRALVARCDAWDESKVKRGGDPKNRGRFSKGSGGTGGGEEATGGKEKEGSAPAAQSAAGHAPVPAKHEEDNKPEPRPQTGIVGVPGSLEAKFAGTDLKALKKKIMAGPSLTPAAMEELGKKKWSSYFRSAGNGIFPVSELMPEGEHHAPTEDVLKVFAAAANGDYTRRDPIVVDFIDGKMKVVDGRSTLAALKYLGLEEVPVVSRRVADSKKVKGIAYNNWMGAIKARVGQRIPNTIPEDLDKHIGQLPEPAQKKLRAMYEQAAEAFPGYQDAINEIAASAGGTPDIPKMKGGKRSVEKIIGQEAGNPEGLRDIIRGSILVDSFEGARRAIEGIQARFKTVGRTRNLFFTPEGRTPATQVKHGGCDGYRDFKCNIVLPNGHVGEVQVHVPEIAYAKERGDGHLIYEERRPLDDKPRLNGAETERYDALNERSRAVYEPAWRAAKGKSALNSATDSSAPLRVTAPIGKGVKEPSGRTRLASMPPSGVRRTTTALPSTSHKPNGRLRSRTMGITSTSSIPQTARKAASKRPRERAAADTCRPVGMRAKLDAISRMIGRHDSRVAA